MKKNQLCTIDSTSCELVTIAHYSIDVLQSYKDIWYRQISRHLGFNRLTLPSFEVLIQMQNFSLFYAVFTHFIQCLMLAYVVVSDFPSSSHIFALKRFNRKVCFYCYKALYLETKQCCWKIWFINHILYANHWEHLKNNICLFYCQTCTILGTLWFFGSWKLRSLL